MILAHGQTGQVSRGTGNLRAGAAKVDITPPAGVRLPQYNRKQPSRGLHDPLHARAVVLEVGGTRVAIVACDLIQWSSTRIRDAARERLGIPHVLVCASHTHSGPAPDDKEVCRANTPYSAFVEESMVGSLEQACAQMFPARIAAAYGDRLPALGYQRLLMQADGHKRALWRDEERIPYGPVDPEVGVIRIDDDRAAPRVVLMNYACHAVVNAINLEVSADYPGAAASAVEEHFGSGLICLFVQGASGDINPLFRSPNGGPGGDPATDYGQMERMGALLAGEVIRVAREITRHQAEATLGAVDALMTFRGRFRPDWKRTVGITTVLINESIAIATFPGEPFVKFQIDWKRQPDIPHPFLFGCTYSCGGEWPGYVADVRSAALGGYGADSSEGALEFGAGKAIMNRHLERFYRLKGIVRDSPGPP